VKLSIASIAIALFFPVYASQGDDAPPVLPFVKAAEIAQETLQKQNLPQEYFLRSLGIVYPKDSGEVQKYEARYEPVNKQRLMVGTEPDRSPLKYHVISITMDGVATIEEKIIDRSNFQSRIVKSTPAPTPSEAK